MERVRRVDVAVNYLKNLLPSSFTPTAAVTLGTGLSVLADKIDPALVVAYRDIPEFPVSTVESHAGELIFGRLGGKNVAALAGRFHLYEGYSPFEVTMPVRVLADLGVEAFIFSNAAGGLNTSWRAGTVMLITDHINLFGQNPLTGPNIDQWGERFPEMVQVYDRQMMDHARQAAAQRGVELHEGVYVGLPGPSMETPAETRMLGRLGADAVGMSTVLEVIAARHHGLRVAGFSAISNINDPDDMRPAPLELVIENAGKAGNDMSALIEGVLERL